MCHCQKYMLALLVVMFVKLKISSNTIKVQLQVMQYVFQIKTLSKDIPIFQRQDWLKTERDNEVEKQCIMSITNYSKCEWDGL